MFENAGQISERTFRWSFMDTDEKVKAEFLQDEGDRHI